MKKICWVVAIIQVCILINTGCGTATQNTLPRAVRVKPGASGELVQPETSGDMVLDFVNVGQGSSCIIRIESGNDDFFAIIDTGIPAYSENVMKELEELGCDDIEVLVLTHPDYDHIGGTNQVIGKYVVEEMWESGVSKDTQAWHATSSEIDSKSILRKRVVSGNSYKWAGANVKVLNPPTSLQKGTGADENNNSVVLLITLGDQDLLLMGDAEVPAQKYLLSNELPPIEVCQVPHHGGVSAYYKPLIDTLDPEVSVISVGPNSYGHPGTLVIDALKQHGSVYRTDINGNVEVRISKSDYKVIEEK